MNAYQYNKRINAVCNDDGSMRSFQMVIYISAVFVLCFEFLLCDVQFTISLEEIKTVPILSNKHSVSVVMILG